MHVPSHTALLSALEMVTLDCHGWDGNRTASDQRVNSSTCCTSGLWMGSQQDRKPLRAAFINTLSSLCRPWTPGSSLRSVESQALLSPPLGLLLACRCFGQGSLGSRGDGSLQALQRALWAGCLGDSPRLFFCVLSLRQGPFWAPHTLHPALVGHCAPGQQFRGFCLHVLGWGEEVQQWPQPSSVPTEMAMKQNKGRCGFVLCKCSGPLQGSQHWRCVHLRCPGAS